MMRQRGVGLIKALARRVFGRGSVRSWGQNGEDAVVHALLRSVKDGTYVDVGAYHPILYSNTFSFYCRGWRGIAVDPNIAMRPLYRFLRPRDRFVHAGVGEKADMQTYYAFSDGAYNTFDAREAEIRKSIPHLRFIGTQSVPMRPLRDIISESGITRIDFLNVDVEGLDLQVLASHDWTMRPRIVAVECTTFDPDRPDASPTYRFLREKGYVLKGFAAYTLLFADAA